MSRPIAILVAIIALLAGGFATTLYQNSQTAGLSETEVRSIVSDALADQEFAAASPQLDASAIHPMIESYLMSNPRILERMSDALQAQVATEAAEKSKVALTEMHDEIYNSPENVVLGNPDGDVTLVEMFDYNCGYCRSSVPDMATLLETDPNLKIILKEFPILSKESVDAARIAIAAHRAGVDYWAFHSQLFGGRGQVDQEAALAAAENLGLNRVDIALDAGSEDVTKALQSSYRIAKAVNTSGTPTYIIGDEVIPGAIGLEELQKRIANLRACGSTVCEG